MKRRLSTEEIAVNKPEAAPSNNGLVLTADNEMEELGRTATDKLRRFCYLGTVEKPVYVHTTFDLVVETHFSNLRSICAEVNVQDFVECLRSVLEASNAEYLSRRDEPLLVLAVFLSTRSNEQERTVVRTHFSQFVSSDKDLFQFAKYVKDVQKCLDRKTPFSRTVRKAILEWYAQQSVSKLLHMWSVNETGMAAHKDLLHRCHYTDAKFEPEIMAVLRLLYTPMKEVSEWPDFLKPVVKSKMLIQGIAKLRLKHKFAYTQPQIEKLGLSFEHVPRHMLNNKYLTKYLMSIMSYEELLQTWPKFYIVSKKVKKGMGDFTQMYMEDEKLRVANVEPIRFLLQTERITKPKKVISKGTVKRKQPCFMHDVYKKSFGFNKALGLRLQITLNLEMCYLGKALTGRWTSIKYIDAMVAVAFGYFKSDPEVKVQFWYDKTGQFKDLTWSAQMSVDEAKYCCVNQRVHKIKQTLTDVVECALNDTKQTYDVFLVIVPSATRGNAKGKSDRLTQRLEEYRQKRNKNAKFIIMSLRQQQASMDYSAVRNENILEICSINEQAPRVIKAFAHNKFN